jgi:hypothetical protein
MGGIERDFEENGNSQTLENVVRGAYGDLLDHYKIWFEVRTAKWELIEESLKNDPQGTFKEVNSYWRETYGEDLIKQDESNDDSKGDSESSGLNPGEESIYERRREKWSSMRAERIEGSRSKAERKNSKS